jgi:hypothetical protein
MGSNQCFDQCCGFLTFWCRSGSGFGSADPTIFFVIDLQDANKKLTLKKIFLLLFEVSFTSFSKIKSQKEVTKQ